MMQFGIKTKITLIIDQWLNTGFPMLSKIPKKIIVKQFSHSKKQFEKCLTDDP